MSRNKFLYSIMTMVIIAIIFYSFMGNGNQENYLEDVLNKRKETDSFMRNSDESPFKNAQITYEGLNYFDPDPAYKLTARFELLEKGEIRKIPTSDGKVELYREYGYVNFELNDRQNRLLVLQMVGGTEHIFIPFADSTSGDDTYGAGRYLEVPNIDGNKIELDFNHSYNPYCAYSADFSCPLPPAENYLAISILAGEKNYD